MLAVIGGSGVHEIDGLANKRWVKVESPFGALSGGPSVGGLGPVQSSLVFMNCHCSNPSYEMDPSRRGGRPTTSARRSRTCRGARSPAARWTSSDQHRLANAAIGATMW